MKKIFTTLFFLTIAVYSQITTPYLYHSNSGNWSGTGISGIFRDLGIDSWYFTFQAGSSIDNYYKIYNQSENNDDNFNLPSGSKVWSGDLVINNSSKQTIFAYGDGSGSAGKFSITNSKYYTLIWKDVSTSSNSEGFVFETSSQPVTITSVTNNYVSGHNDVTVSITLSASKSSEEKIFVRYTNDSWSTDNFVEATGSGTSYTATIPGADVGTAGDEFYVLTTTLNEATMEGLNADVDLATIAFNNNSGSNYAVPVELTSFSAVTSGKEVTLNWQTATEVTNYGFDVERSQTSNVKGQMWERIGFVNGYGNSNSPKSYSFVDKDVTNGFYNYRLKQIDTDGKYEYSPTVEVTINNLPKQFELSQNYPNPFNPSTIIKYALPIKEFVQLRVFNVLGNEIATLVNEVQEAGSYKIDFNAAKLNVTTSGIYFYRLEAGSFIDSRKMTLVK